MKVMADCAQAEILAGAIALGEAADAQRHLYREHLSTCRRCLGAIGGELEIERVANVVAQARDQERWQPDLRRTFLRLPSRNRTWTWAGGAGLATAAIFAFAIVATALHRPVIMHSTAMPMRSNFAAAVNARDIASLGTQTQPRGEHQAESLVFSPAASRARTITLQVSIDERGRPTGCSIIKRSGRTTLDAAVCDAVMRTRR